MIVLDASVVVDLLLRTPLAAQIETRLFRSGETLHAPHLIDVEVTQALRRLAMQRQIDPDRGRDALTDLVDLPIRRYPHGWLVASAWTLRANVSSYDAIYVALADALDAPLLTRDRRLASAADRMDCGRDDVGDPCIRRFGHSAHCHSGRSRAESRNP